MSGLSPSILAQLGAELTRGEILASSSAFLEDAPGATLHPAVRVVLSLAGGRSAASVGGWRGDLVSSAALGERFCIRLHAPAGLSPAQVAEAMIALGVAGWYGHVQRTEAATFVYVGRNPVAEALDEPPARERIPVEEIVLVLGVLAWLYVLPVVSAWLEAAVSR